MNYLPRTYVTDENIADTENKLTTFIKHPNKTLSQDVEDLVATTLHFGDADEKKNFNEIIIMRLDKSITQSMKRHLTTPKAASLQDLAFHATALIRLQRGHKELPYTNMASYKNQNQSPACPTCGSTAKVILI